MHDAHERPAENGLVIVRSSKMVDVDAPEPSAIVISTLSSILRRKSKSVLSFGTLSPG